MRAMVLEQLASLADQPEPLTLQQWPDPQPGRGEVLIEVVVCGVCHTELDEIEGRTPPSDLPAILGHQVIGNVIEVGGGVERHGVGDRVGVAWIFSACGHCSQCAVGNENLCPEFRATGRDAPGGYAELMTVPEDFAYRIPDDFAEVEAAPLLCAGAIGYRSLRLTGLENGQRLGLTGFGGSGHQVLKMVRHLFPDSPVSVFARNPEEQEFARELGAVWAGGTEDVPPEPLHCIIDTTPVWKPVVAALGQLVPGGRLVINAIRKEDVDQAVLQELDYPTHLWHEKEIKTVANVTRRDVQEFLKLAAEMRLQPTVEEYGLEDANAALNDLKHKHVRGGKVLRMR